MIKEESKCQINRNEFICNYPYFASKDEDGRIVAVFIMVAGSVPDSLNSMTYFIVSDDGTFRTMRIGKDQTFDAYFAEEESIYEIEDKSNIKFTEIICDLS
ncbi:hypothetical protein [Phocaeicola sp.]|uniref:hypothetical protein n=1 Tax=Phocaeicola sp. TaxID=2773926 RepID=UPI003AF01E34